MRDMHEFQKKGKAKFLDFPLNETGTSLLRLDPIRDTAHLLLEPDAVVFDVDPFNSDVSISYGKDNRIIRVTFYEFFSGVKIGPPLNLPPTLLIQLKEVLQGQNIKVEEGEITRSRRVRFDD